MRTESVRAVTGGMRRRRSLLERAVVGVGCCLAVPASAGAASILWNTNSNAAYDSAASWNPAVIPGPADTEIFSRGVGVSYTVFLNSPPALPPVNYVADQLRVRSNTVNTNGFARASWTLDNPATDTADRGIIVGWLAADVATLNINFLVQLSAGAMTVAEGTGSTGTFSINGGCTLALTGSDPNVTELIVGRNGTGTMNINSNSLVSLPNSPNSDVRIGGDTSALGNGTMNVTGGGVLNTGGMEVVGSRSRH
jgi:hypothetical protein